VVVQWWCQVVRVKRMTGRQNHMSFQKTVLTLASVGVFAPVSGLAQIAIPASSTPPLLPPVMVYASRFEEKAADALPQTSIVTAAAILASGASNVSEVLSRVVGLPTTINLDGSTNAVVDMRGYGDTASNNMVVLLDGVRISENEQAAAKTSMIPLEIIDHIEVTYGGNSVLYGDGATGGTIHIVTKKQVGDLSVVSGGLSSYSGVQTSLYQSKALGTSQLSVFGRGLNSNGYRDGATTKERSFGMNWVTDMDGQSRVGVRMMTAQEKNTLPGPLPSVDLESSPTNRQVPGYTYNSISNTTTIALFGSKKMGDAEFSLDVARREKSNDSRYRYNAEKVFTGYSPTLSPAPNDPWFPQPAPINTFAFSESGIKSNTQSFSPRLKVMDFAVADNTLIVGVDKTSTGRYMNAVLTNAYTPDTLNTSVSQVNFSTQGFYLRDDWQLTNVDRVTMGYRTQHYSESNAGTSQWESSGTASANEIQYTRVLTPALTAYLKSSQNFRLPNVDDNNSVNYDANWNPIRLVPQISRDTDAGLVYTTFHWQSEVRVFKSKIRNEIAYDPGANQGYGGNINYDPTLREGVNLRQHVRLNRQWDAGLNLHYVKAVFTESTYANNQAPNTARHTGNVQLGYQVSTAHRLTLTSRFASDKFASGDYLNQQAKVSGYVVHDLGYRYQQATYSLTATVSNLFNKQYTDLGIFKPNNGSGYYYIPPYNMTVYPNPGRSFSLMGRYNF